MRPVDAPSGMPFNIIQITVEDGQDPAIVRVLGDIDITSAPRLGAELARLIRERRNVILDAAGVAYFGLSGVRALESAADTGTDPSDRTSSRILVISDVR